MRLSAIYKIINRINQHYYVGCSTNVFGRWIEHRYDLNQDIHCTPYLQNSWNKHGPKSFEFVIVENLGSMKMMELLKVEQKYLDIAKLEQDKCYNTTFDSSIGHLWEPTALRKRAITITGSGNPFYGKRHTEETKEMIRQARKKQTFSIETRKKISDHFKKIKRTDEWKNNISKSLRAYRQKISKIHSFKNIITNEIITMSSMDFADMVEKQLGKKMQVSSLICGKQKVLARTWILAP